MGPQKKGGKSTRQEVKGGPKLHHGGQCLHDKHFTQTADECNQKQGGAPPGGQADGRDNQGIEETPCQSPLHFAADIR